MSKNKKQDGKSWAIKITFLTFFLSMTRQRADVVILIDLRTLFFVRRFSTWQELS